MAAAVTGSLLTAAPAHAVSGGSLLGHRCHTDTDPAVTNENTVKAMVEVRGVTGVWCETDVWRISDGTLIVWHDSTWGRVADHATLPAGVQPTDPVTKAGLTWEQVRQIRTKGGEPVPRYEEMITASAANGVPLVVEVRNSVPNPSYWVDYARSAGASVRYYRLPGASSTCPTIELDRLRAAGAVIGIKMPGATAPCQLTPAQLEAKGASFITESTEKVTTAYTSDLRSRGVEFYARGAGKYTAKDLLAKGAARLLVEDPRVAANW